MTSQVGQQTKQPDNKARSINRIPQEKFFFFKNYVKNELGRLVPDLLLLFKKV